MGYTHYFEQKRDCPAKAWELISSDFGKILGDRDARGLIQREYDNPAPPEVGPRIRFNGIGEAGHETMLVSRKKPKDESFQFCKTAYKPYDAVVVALLLVMFHHTKSDVWDIGSDGDWDEWVNGRELYARVLGRKPDRPAL